MPWEKYGKSDIPSSIAQAGVDGGAWPFLINGVICLVTNFVRFYCIFKVAALPPSPVLPPAILDIF